MNVLVLESDPAEAKRICAVVSRAGHRAQPASTELLALIMLQTSVYDLVLWDLDMAPDMCVGFIRKWKGVNGAWLLAAFTRENTREKEAAARAEGAIRFLHKPASEEDLRQILTFAESRSPARLEI
ncbi:MAG: response regulator [Thermodesulfobacteriota bacterium]